MVCNNVEKFGNENNILRNTVRVTSLVQESAKLEYITQIKPGTTRFHQ